MPGSACPQRAEPPGWSVTSATIPSGIPPSLWAPPHSCARPCTTVWLGGRVDPWRTHGGLVAWLIGRGACGTHGRIDRAAVLRMACVRGRLCGVRTAACPTGPPAFLAVGTVACVGALQWPRWRGPLPRLALRRQLPAASAGDRGSAVALRTWGVRARAASTGGCARLPTWPSADSPLMRIRWEDRTVGESAPSGWRGERVEETGCKKKRCCHKSPLSWP